MSNDTQAKLTEIQEAEIPAYRKKWSAIGLNCEPANRPEAEKNFYLAYGSISAVDPRYTVWAGSPLMGCFMCGLFGDPEKGAYHWLDKFNGALDPILVIATNETIDISDWDVLNEAGELKDGTTLSVANAWKSLWMQLCVKAVDIKVREARQLAEKNIDLTYTCELVIALGVTLEGCKRIGKVMFDEYLEKRLAEVESNGRQKAWDACYGSHDASWLGFYDFFHKVVKYEKCAELAGLIGAAQHTGWFWPFECLCISSERHNFISLDDNERPSNTKRAAVEYPDGFKIFAVGGVQVPAWLVENPKSLTPDHILRERNAEVRRIMLGEEFMPRERFMRETGATLVSEDEFGKLYRATMKTAAGEDFTISGVEVVDGTVKRDGTQRVYWLGALNTHETPRQAVSWSYSLDKSEDYRPTIRK